MRPWNSKWSRPNKTVITIAIFFAHFFAVAETLVVGYFEVPPHVVHQVNGPPTGAAVDLFMAVTEKMGVTDIRFEQLPLARLLRQLQSGQTDVALFIAKTPEREATFFYPKQPFYVAQPSVVVSSTSPLLHIKSVTDILPLTIGVMSGVVLSASMREPGLKLFNVSGGDVYSRSLQMLGRGRLDAVYCPDPKVLFSAAESLGMQEKIRILKLPDAGNGTYYAFSPGAAKIFALRYAQALESVVRERGTYAQAFLK